MVRLVVRPHQERFRQQLGTGFLPHKPLWCLGIMMTMMRRGDGVDDDDGGISMLGAGHILPYHTQSEKGQQVMTIDNKGGHYRKLPCLPCVHYDEEEEGEGRIHVLL